MSELTIAAPLSGEEVVDAIVDKLRLKLERDCHLNPALAYLSFKVQLRGVLTLQDNGRDVEIVFELEMGDEPPNVVRQRAGLPIPTLVEDSSGKKEVKNVKYGRMSAQSGPGGTQQDPGKPQPGQEKNPHPPGSPEHEKHEKERKEKEEREKKEQTKR